MSRIGLLQQPFPEPFAADMAKMTAPGREPLALFTSIGQSPRAWERFTAAAMSGPSPLSMRDREVVIIRTSAKTGGEYEWGIHSKVFGKQAELTPEQVRSTFDGHADDGNWNEHDAALIAATDALLTRHKLDDAEFARLSGQFDTTQILEIIQLISFYHGIAMITGALDLQPEAGMPRFPTA